jgi:hypothetical protein
MAVKVCKNHAYIYMIIYPKQNWIYQTRQSHSSTTPSPLNVKAANSFEMLKLNNPATQYINPGYLNSQSETTCS